ncbi:3'-5' exonuclease [Candidatus Pacearchaeota archaeon]|nr:3'-5' exonuclease [Candidatus Pacearchaeota archaeon]
MQLITFQDLIRRYYSGEEFVLFDTETTGLNTFHDDIVEIAGMIWQKGQEPKTFQEIIKVNLNKMSDGAWEIHKIPKEEIEAARESSDVLNDFLAFAGDRSLLAHNIRFDYEILNSNLMRSGLKPYQNDQAACSLAYAKEQSMPGRLSELAKYYKVKVTTGDLHRALYDVEVLMEVMNKMVKEHEPEEMQYSLIL